MKLQISTISFLNLVVFCAVGSGCTSISTTATKTVGQSAPLTEATSSIPLPTYSPPIVAPHLTSEILEKYKGDGYLILFKGQASTRTHECDFMTDRQTFTLLRSEIHPDGTWKIVVRKSVKSSLFDPKMMEAGEKPKVIYSPSEIWTILSTDAIVAPWTDSTTGNGDMPVDSGLARPIIVSPQGVIFKKIWSAC